FNFPLAYTILLVTCYSEGEAGMRATLDSLALTDYPASHKLIVVIADGVIVGAGNQASTPDICLTMMKDFVIPADKVQPYSYIAIADGTKRHNMAKIYAGYYKFDERVIPAEKQPRVPMILISKCGTAEEQSLPKPGNRGKRDSQIILMSFLQHVMFDDRMTEMEYEFFNAIWSVTGVSPDHFEIVLMVDADTKVYPDSVTRMVSCMVRDPQIMGLCGETKIANKRDSWVTMIQVFEYYISHHQSKAFESIFGGVTCLPGCFCMYRIKAPKGPTNHWVPVLASPEIVEHYSENVVDTLHKKNLLLLGEDRYLTTLMLRTFPKRKMIFVPQAVCKTVVPDTFSILLSQRRRWINSTIHNLLELVLIRDLCGTFCFSMQFVVFMELVGTVVLPAAICFTIYLVVISFFTTPVPIIPLVLLAIILGLPAALILMTTRKIVYVGWMLIYLLSLFLWNFVLPVYAFWHFDDFSWGQTRQVVGEEKGGDHGDKEGAFDSSRIVMKRWAEFEKEKRKRTEMWLNGMNSANNDTNRNKEDGWPKLGYNVPSQLARMNMPSEIESASSSLSHMPTS
ncbi:fungal chitin synthase, partial [Basidiobolus meristosporus CBS 931.73]